VLSTPFAFTTPLPTTQYPIFVPVLAHGRQCWCCPFNALPICTGIACPRSFVATTCYSTPSHSTLNTCPPQSGAGSDRLLKDAYAEIGQYYADRQKWSKAAAYFEQGGVQVPYHSAYSCGKHLYTHTSTVQYAVLLIRLIALPRTFDSDPTLTFHDHTTPAGQQQILPIVFFLGSTDGLLVRYGQLPAY
jgi:hypothetical protein